ncbi:MAG: transcription termination/antitermination NusG family protein [Candidatus Brocadiia bacterium]
MKSAQNLWHESLRIEYTPSRPWFVAHTKARHEKKLSDCLTHKGITNYLPLAVNISRTGGRTRFYESPLFSGYLFVSSEAGRCEEVFDTHCVANLIPVFDQTKLVSELLGVQSALRNLAHVEPYHHVRSGLKARFVRGPMTGMEAMVVSRKREYRVLLNVEVIRRSICVECDLDDIEIVDNNG